MNTETITIIVFIFDALMIIGLLTSYATKQIRHYKTYGGTLPTFKMENLTYNDKQLLLIIALVAFNSFLAMMVLL